MTAYNIVRFKVKSGKEKAFEDAHRGMSHDLSGFEGGALVNTGASTYCFVGRWKEFDDIAAARPKMIAILDRFRDMLEDLGEGRGVTDPVSGPVAVDLPAGKG